MAEKYSSGERNLAAAETAAGAGIGLTAASGKVPQIVNSWARRDRKVKYERVKSQLADNDLPRDHPNNTEKKTPDFTKGKGYDPSGKKYVPLKSLPEDTTRVVEHVNPKTGQTFPKKEKYSARAEAYNAAWKKHDEAKNVLHNKANVPFPESEWEYNDKGKRLKKVVAKDPKTNTPITNKAGKIKMIRQPAAVGHFRRAAVIGVGLPVGMGLAWHGARTWAHQGELKRGEVTKNITRGEVDGAVVGGSIGGALYQAPSFTEWGGRAKEDKKTLKKPKAKKILSEWKTKYDLHGIQRGDPRWTEGYRHYPKKLPGAEMRRVMSYTHAGGSGLAATGAAAGIGALIGAQAVRSGKKRRLERKT
jgi:hypothetical protein